MAARDPAQRRAVKRAARRGVSKKLSVANAVRRGRSRSRIEREVAKCEVLCANCHAKRHRQERW